MFRQPRKRPEKGNSATNRGDSASPSQWPPPYPQAPTDTEAHTDTQAHRHTQAHTDPQAPTDTEAHTDTQAHRDTQAHKDTQAHTGTQAHTPLASRVAAAFSSYDGDLSLPLGLALGSPIFPSGCEGKLGVALEQRLQYKFPWTSGTSRFSLESFLKVPGKVNSRYNRSRVSAYLPG